MVSIAVTSFGEVPVPLNRRIGVLPPDPIGVAAAEAPSVPADTLPLSQAKKAIEIRRRKAVATMRDSNRFRLRTQYSLGTGQLVILPNFKGSSSKQGRPLNGGLSRTHNHATNRYS